LWKKILGKLIFILVQLGLKTRRKVKCQSRGLMK